MLQSLSAIDGMNIRFPWKIRTKTFADFVRAMPGLLCDASLLVSIDHTSDIQPFLDSISSLALPRYIVYLLSNSARKDKLYKHLKHEVAMYKHSLQICTMLQNICFQSNAPMFDKLRIHNLQSNHSRSFRALLTVVESQNGHSEQQTTVSALQLLLHFEAQRSILQDLKLDFYQKQSVRQSKTCSLGNIDWSAIPLVLQPKWLMLNGWNKSEAESAKSIQWKQYQIESFYAILKSITKGVSNTEWLVYNFTNRETFVEHFREASEKPQNCRLW